MIDKKYQELLQDILENGVEKKDRTGTGTISVFGRQIRYKFKDGKFPLLTTKKMYWKGIVTELLWFLRGDTNIKFLIDNGCNIWNGDAYKRFSEIRKSMLMLKSPTSEDKLREYIEWYEQITTQEEFINKIKTDDEFARRCGDLGSIYGKQWRNWGGELSLHIGLESDGSQDKINFKKGIDQIQNSINLLKTDPDSRRNIVSAWNVGELDKMVLPPCHNFFQFYTRELSFAERRDLAQIYAEENNKLPLAIDAYGREGIPEYMDTIDNTGWNIPKRVISLMYNQRSVDTLLGLPFNIASYGLLLKMIAKEVNMIPDELIGNLGDVHLYRNHIQQAKEQLTREPMDLPKVLINNGDVDNNGTPFTKSILDGYDITDFELVNYKSHPPIKAPLSN